MSDTLSPRRVPTVLEYFAYLFHYSMLFAGPVCTFKEYMDFIEGKDIAVHKDSQTGVGATIYCLSFSI